MFAVVPCNPDYSILVLKSHLPVKAHLHISQQTYISASGLQSYNLLTEMEYNLIPLYNLYSLLNIVYSIYSLLNIIPF